MNFKTAYIYDLVDKISPQLRKINNSLQKTTNQVRKTSNKSIDSFKKMGRSIDLVASKSQKLGKSLFLKLTLPLGLAGTSFVKAASDAEETSSKFATVFQDISLEADRTAKNLGKSFGLSSVKAKELLGDTGDLLTGFGFSGKAALDLSKGVNELAVDLASFTNFSGGAEGASKALTKALLGERESVKSLGISILEEDVKAKVKSLAATGKLTGMTERQSKAYATLQIAISQSKNAIGDFERTSKSFANQTRILNQRFFDLKVSFGNIILPLATKLIQKLTILTEKFTALSPKTKKLILILSGIGLVLPPILITIGLMATGIKLLIPAIKGVGIALRFLALNPLGLLITGIATLLIASKDFRNNFISIFNFIAQKAGEVFNAISNKIDAFSNKLANFAESIGFDLGISKGQELDKILAQQKKELAFKVERNQSVDIGGMLGININAPSGSSANFTPSTNSPINTSVNFTQANPLF